MNSLISVIKWRITQSIYVIFAFSCSSVLANISEMPVLGGIFNAGEIMRDQIISSVSASTKLTRDITLFTIAGVSLDVYILSLPLDSEVKARVISQLSDPSYAIPLGHFLYSYYDRYGGLSPNDEFKQYLKTRYSPMQLKGFEHSLYQVGVDSQPREIKTPSNNGNHQGVKVDRQFIASLVTIYDALVDIGEWQDMDALPNHYTYLTSQTEDIDIINKIQPIIIGLMMKASNRMDPTEMKAVLLDIIEDGDPQHRNKVNNKAQALTITLIDFVRLNVLKAYRQFVFKQEREAGLNSWMLNTFDEDADELIKFLLSQQKRRYGVQIAVDGLQQGLIEGLVDPSKPFINHAYQIHQSHEELTVTGRETNQPEHEQQVKFMSLLARKNYQDPNYLPFFKRLYLENRDSITQVGISSTPTISVRNLPIIKTGAKVSGKGGTGIPNFHFVDREQDRAYYFFGNDAIQLDRLMESHGVRTMFDRLAYLNTLNCNAQYDWNAHTSFDGLVNLGVGEVQRDYGEKRCLRELSVRAKVEGQLRALRQELIEDIQGYQEIFFLDIVTKLTKKWKIEKAISELAKLDGLGMPDYTLIYNPWPDHFAHFAGPFSDEIIMPTGELNRLDYWLAQTEKAYKDAGIYDQTLWGMAGDHGLSPVFHALNPEKRVFEALSDELGYPILVKKISSDEGEGPKITNALNYSSHRGVDVVVASTAGGNMMMDFFNSAMGWTVQPVYEELVRWAPINAKDKSQTLDIVAETASRLSDSLDYMVLREHQCSVDKCQVRLVGYRDDKRIDERVELRGDKLFYASLSGIEPILLDIQQLNPYKDKPSESELNHYTNLKNKCLQQAKQQDITSWCSVLEWRELTRFTPRPDSVNQVARLYEEDRAGTINLFPKAGIGFNTKVPGRHAGEDYLEKDAFLGFWGTPIGDPLPLTIEENGSLAPTMYEFLTGEKIVVGKNGWGYPSLLEKLDIQSAI